MDFFRSVGNWFRGAFGGDDDDEEKKRRQREQQQRQQTQQYTPPKTQVVDTPQQKQQGVQDLFGQKKSQPQEEQQLFQQNQPNINLDSLRRKAQAYQVPKVQDVNNYYANDLKVLNDELAKGDKADATRIQGVMQSLDNRRKELEEFHNERGKAKSFKSARDLQEKVKATRGDWTDVNSDLQKFWENVSKDEAKDFLAFLGERNDGFNTIDWRRGEDFGAQNDMLERVRVQQENEDTADKLLSDQYKDARLSKFGNSSIQEIYNYFNSASPEKRRADIVALENAIEKDDIDEELKNQATLLYILLTTRGEGRTSAFDKLQGFSDTAADKIGGGFGRGLLRGADFLLPGKNTFGLEGVADEWDERAQASRRMQADQRAADIGATAGSIVKGIGDIGLMLAPVAKVDTVARGSKIAQNASRLPGVAGRSADFTARVLPGSLAGTAIDTLQEVGRGNEVDLVKSGGVGLAIDTAVELATSRFKPAKTGIKRLFGETGDEIVEGGTAASATAATRREAIDEVLDDALNAREVELQKVVEDVDVPSYMRREAKAELEGILADKAKAANPDLPIDEVPAFVHKKQIADIIEAETSKLEQMIAANPGLTRQQLEAAQEATKERITKLVEQLQANRRAGLEAVEGQAEATAKAADQQSAVTGEVQAQQTARTAPNAGDVVETQPVTSPEVTANNAYATDEQALFGDAPRFTEKSRPITQTLSPDRIIRERITNPVENLVNKGINRAQTSTNPFSRAFGRFFTGFSTEAGRTAEELAQRRLLRGGAEEGKLYREATANLTRDITEESQNRIFATLDPRRADELGMAPVSVQDLTPEELAVREQLDSIRNYTTQENLKRGLITIEQASDPDYLKRMYTPFEDNAVINQAYDESRQSLLSQFKGRKDVDQDLLEQAITDPGYLVAKKSAESHAAWAMVDYSNYLVDSGIAVPQARPGYRQLPNSKLYGKASGQWVPGNVAEDFTGFEYSMGMLNAFNDLISAYDNLAIRRGKKALLTVFNPAVRIGNQFSNRVVFANMNGINPIQFNKNMILAKQAMKENSQLYREAVQQGLTGIDVTQADFARRLLSDVGDDNIAKQGLNWFKDSYSAADDQARVAAYITHRNRGLSPEEAARLTQRGFQDYKSVGFFYDMAAKTPLIGNAFVRFAGDALRIAKNAAVDHPLRSAATIAMWASFVNGMSTLSGESAEDKKTREDRFGAPKIPFTDISMTVQTPYGEVNVARFLPFYQLNDIGSPVSRFAPIAENPLTPEGWQDPLLGQFGQIATDTDFRGKSIQDPENTKFPDGTSKFEYDQLSDEDKRNNVLRFLFTQNAPLGREIDSLKSAYSGEEDVYGKTRSPGQAWLRALGIKNEQFGAEQAADTRNTEAYFERRDAIEQELEGLSPEAQAAYRRLTGQYKLREEVPNEFAEGETRNLKAPVYDFGEQKYGEYMQNPDLYDLMAKRAKRESQANGAPLNPIFDERLPRDFRYQLVQQRSIAPGDDVELFERMTTSPYWDIYQQLNDEYRKKAANYYPESNGEFYDEMVKHQDAKFPEKPAVWKAYLDARNRGEEPAWTDQVKEARTEYERAKLQWTNTERKARGLPPIPEEQWFNETFGYNENAGSGYGGGGWEFWANLLGRLSNYSSDVNRLDAVEAQAPPELAQLFRSLQAERRGGRAQVRLGASSRGQ